MNHLFLNALFTGLLFACASVSSSAQPVKGGLSKPNVLFIMVDDLRPELGCYNASHIVSPNIDRLAARGHLFTSAYANYPSCGPSRASLLSGLYPGRTRFNRWNCSQDEEVPGIVSLPMHFRNQDYRTVSLGKVYNNFEDGRGSWDEVWRPGVTTTDWDYQSKEGIRIFEDANAQRYTNTKSRNNKNLPRRGPAFEQPDIPDIAYRDGRIASKAIDKLQEFQVNGQPFFLAVGFHKPHLPFNAPKKYWDLYNEKDIRLAENAYVPKNAPEVSLHNSSELRAYFGIPKRGPFSDSLSGKLIHGYFASVSYVDAQVGKVLDALENLGLEEETIVVLLSDHGWQLGEHTLWCKHANYKTSLQIPLIVRVPGKDANIRQTNLVESVDIYPTLCDLAGLDQPFHLQGRSFADLFDNGGMSGKQTVFSRSGPGGETVITNTHSYTEFFDAHGEVMARMLYDLRVDNEENVNVAEQNENRNVIKKLSEMLKRHMEERDRIILGNH